MAISRLAIVKFLELALTCVLIGLHYHSFQGGDMNELLLMTGTFCGFLLILIGGSAGHVMNSPFNKRIDIFFSLMGAVLFIASGALAIKLADGMWKGETRDINMSKGVIAIIAGAVFLVDSVITWRE